MTVSLARVCSLFDNLLYLEIELLSQQIHGHKRP